MRYKIPLAMLLVASPLPLAAQAVAPTEPSQELPYDRGYDKQTPRHDAVDAVEKPVTETLNTRAAVVASGTRAAVATVNNANEAHYEADMAAYRAAVQANQQQITKD